jgi:hypothetical protein
VNAKLFFMQEGCSDDEREIALANQGAGKQSGVVKTVKFISGQDADVCAACKRHDRRIVGVQDGVVRASLPPLDACTNARCCC